jgi:maleylpyruvate isomerase
MSLVLRSYWRSSCSWRVRIGLNWKQLSYDIVPVHLVADGGHQHTDEHRALNPMRELPVLLVEGKPLAQSVAILEYLEETYPEPPLLPKSPLDRARVRQMTEVVNSGIQPVQNLRVMQRLGREYELPRTDQVGWSREWIAQGLVALETLVSAHGGRYSFGDAVSFADLCLVPQLYNARRFDVDMSAFPALTAVESELVSLPAFVAAHPDQQPDAA